MILLDGQWQTGISQRLIHARDFSFGCSGSPNLSRGVGRVVAPVSVAIRRAEKVSEEKRAGRKFQDTAIVSCRRISQTEVWIYWICVHGVSENFGRYTSSEDSDCISLIDRSPDISVNVQSNAVNSLKPRIRDKDVI